MSKEKTENKSKSFRDLLVWQTSLDLAEKAYKLCDSLPKSEDFGLKSQIRRSAVSIPSNIAEGAQRSTKNDFRHFCHMAYGSSAELETQLMLARRIYKIEDETLFEQLDYVQRMLNKLIKSLS